MSSRLSFCQGWKSFVEAHQLGEGGADEATPAPDEADSPADVSEASELAVSGQEEDLEEGDPEGEAEHHAGQPEGSDLRVHPFTELRLAEEQVREDGRRQSAVGTPSSSVPMASP